MRGSHAEAAERAIATDRPIDQDVVLSYRSHRSRVCHAALVLGGWVAFLLLWRRVLVRPGAAVDALVTVIELGGLVLVVALVTWAWIAHNVALARRRGGRRSGTVPLVKPTADRLGRRLELGGDVGTASYVVVRVDGSVKQFVTQEGDRVRDAP
jgi:hypothetical protein